MVCTCIFNSESVWQYLLLSQRQGPSILQREIYIFKKKEKAGVTSVYCACVSK